MEDVFGTPKFWGVCTCWASQGALVVLGHLPMQEMKEIRVPSLGQEDPWRREWLPTPVFLPGGFHGERSLADYSPWGRRVKHD